MKKRIWKRALAAILAIIMVIGLMPDTGASFVDAAQAQIGIGGEVLTAPTDVKWDISPEHFGEGNWTPATKNQWDWLIRIYYRRSESMEWEEVCKQSIANWCRNWTPLACAQRNGKLTSGEYAFTVTPRDKSNLYSDVKDIEGPESEKSSSLIYEKEYFQAKNLQWKDNTATVTWEKPSYVGDMTLTLYQKSEQGKDEPLYKCSVDTETTSIDMSDYITQDGTYYCIMENKNSLFLNNGCVTSKTAEYTISGENLPNVEGLQWRAGESDIGCVEWNAPNSSEENYGGYAVTLYKGEDKVTTIHTDAKTATADLYPYFTGDGNYSFTVRTTIRGAKNIMGAESGKCSYIFDSSKMAVPAVTFTTDDATGTDSTVQWENAPEYVTEDVWQVELYKKAESAADDEKVATVTVTGNSVNFYDVMQQKGTGTYTCKVRGQVRSNANTYGAAGTTSEHAYTYVNEGTGDFIVTGGYAGVDYTYTNYTLLIKTSEPLVISGKTTKDTIQIEKGAQAKVTFDGVSISIENNKPLVLIGEKETETTDMMTSLDLTIKGENICEVFSGWNQNKSEPGIYVGNNTLTVNGSGKLTVTRGGGHFYHIAAGIYVLPDGKVDVQGGTLFAEAQNAGYGTSENSSSGAAIGNEGQNFAVEAPFIKDGHSTGTVIFQGGNVTAVSFGDGACIGIGGGCGPTAEAPGNISAKMKGFQMENSWLVARGENNNAGSSPATAVGGGRNSGQMDLEKTNSKNSVVITYLRPYSNGVWEDDYVYSSEVYGNPVLKNGTPENPKGSKLEIESGESISVGENAILTNNGTIVVKSGAALNIKRKGMLINNGTITVEQGGRVYIEETNQTITTVNEGTYPQRLMTETQITSLQMQGESGLWENILADNYPEYGETIRVSVQVKDTARGKALTGLSKDDYKLYINDSSEPVPSSAISSLENGTATFEFAIKSSDGWQTGENEIKATHSYKEAGWAVTDTEAKRTFKVKKTNFKVKSNNVLAQGTFGDTLAQIIPEGEVMMAASGEIVPGKWVFQNIQNGKSSASIRPKVDGMTEYTAVFMPNDAKAYDNLIQQELSVNIVPEIKYLDAPEAPFSLSGTYTDGVNVWVQENTDKITISPAQGYTMAEEVDGTYFSYIETTLEEIQDGSSNKGFYLKNRDGRITDKILLNNYVKQDNTSPTATVQVEKNAETYLKTYNTFQDNPVKNGVFLNLDIQRSTPSIQIVAEDKDGNNSGIKEILYCTINQKDIPEDGTLTADMVEKQIENGQSGSKDADTASWLSYQQAFSLGRQGTYIVVAKAVDNLGNVSYINTDGLVAYRDSALQENSKAFSYTRTSKETRTAAIDLHGNTLDTITCMQTDEDGWNKQKLINGMDYTVSVDNDTAVVTFSSDWLEILEAGEYILTFTFKPQGVSYDSNSAGDAPEASTAALTVSRANLDADCLTFTPPDDLCYTNTEKQASVKWREGYNGAGDITLVYYRQTETGAVEMSGKPVAPGTYIVKALVDDTRYVFPQDGVTADDWTFTIAYPDKPDTPYRIEGDYTEKDGKTVWLRQGEKAVIIPADGYTISDGSDFPDSFKNALIYDTAVSAGSISVRLMDDMGHLTDIIPVTEAIKVDGEVPEGVIAIEGLDIRSSQLQTEISYDTVIKKEQKLTVSAKDSGSGIDFVQYGILNEEQVDNMNLTSSVSGDEAAKALEQAMKGTGGWKAYNAEEKIALDFGKNAVYVKLKDCAGNISYISSDGIHVETIPEAPNVDAGGYESGTWTKDAVTITVSGAQADSGIDKYQYSTDGGKNWTDMGMSTETGNAAKAQITISEDSDAVAYLFRAITKAGSESAVSDAITAKIDTQQPKINLSGDTDTMKTMDMITVSATAGISGSMVEVSKDGGSYEKMDGTRYEVTENGVYTFRITNGVGVTESAQITYHNIDTGAPVITGIENGGTYYTTRQVSVNDKNLSDISVNGETVRDSETFPLAGNTDKSYTVTAVDKAGNVTEYKVTMKRIASLGASIDGMTAENVKEADRNTISDVKKAVEQVDVKTATDAEKAELQSLRERCDALLAVLNQMKANKTFKTMVTEEEKRSAKIGLNKPVKAGKNKNSLNWAKVKGADGYVVYGSRCNRLKKKHKLKVLKVITSPDRTRYTHKKLKKKTWYKYRIKAYKLVDGKKITIGNSLVFHSRTGNGRITNPANVKLSKSRILLKQGKSAVMKAKLILPKGKRSVYHTDEIRYLVTNENVISVSRRGKVKAKKKGSSIVYVIAPNGVSKKVRVTVK